MTSICICYDEKQQRNMLNKIITREMDLWGYPYQIKEYSNGESLVYNLEHENYYIDIIFLDIELGKSNGVDIAKTIRKHSKDTIIIFVTGFSDYVFHGYDVGALNYILKPYKTEKICKVLKEALKKLEQWKENFITVQIGTNLCKINTKDILYFKSELRKLTVVTFDKTLEYYGKLNDMETVLPSNFIRTHQRYIVNLNHVDSITQTYAKVQNEKIPISRKKYQEVVGKFTRYMLES
ncbi:TPA: response regulator transcription factor [Clostridioides difficile]|nr:response regulator transcription factor [Clostridioides difficile]